MDDQAYLHLVLPRTAARDRQTTQTDSAAVRRVPVPPEDAEPSLAAFAASIRAAVHTAAGDGGCASPDGDASPAAAGSAAAAAGSAAAAAAGSGSGDEPPACWYMLEYCCFGQPVPLLTDEALHEAFSYFREQHQQEQQQQCTSGAGDSPRSATEAAAGVLTLLPTMAQPPWTLHTYLAAKAAAAAAGSGSGGSAAKAGTASSKPQRSRPARACLDLQQPPMKGQGGGTSNSSGQQAAAGTVLLQDADTSARESDQQTAPGGGGAGSSAKSSKVSKSTRGSTPRSEEQQQEQQSQVPDGQQRQLAATPVSATPAAAGGRQHYQWLSGFGSGGGCSSAAAGAGVDCMTAMEPAGLAVPGCFPRLVSSGSGSIRPLLCEVPAAPFLAAGGSGGVGNNAWQAAAAAAAAAAAVAAATAAVEPGSGPAAMDLLLQQKQQLLAVQPVPLVSLGPRGRTETRTKYADGRFKDELRHQQRLTEMDEKCGQLFGGIIRGHFKIEHHKRIICLVCQSLVTPYEAYHVDALRKHFVRHHTPWLAGRGAGPLTAVWQRPPGGSSSSNTSSTTPAAATAVVTREAAAAKGTGNSALAAAAAAAAKAEAAAPPAPAALADADQQGKAPHNSRQPKGFRTADGRYLDPVLHSQRLTSMHQTAAGLFGGCISELFRINSHKSITCLRCNQDVTPYAAYHADCLRKHFVRHHTDLLRAAGVDVLAFSRGIQLGKRKLRELQAEQQASQQQEAQQETNTQQQQQQQDDPTPLPEQPQTQQQQTKQQQGLSQLPTVTGVLMSNGQLLLLPPLPLSAVAAAAAAAAGSAAQAAPGSSNGMPLLQSGQQQAFSSSAQAAGNGSDGLLLETPVLQAANQAGSCNGSGLPAAVEPADSWLQPGSPQLQPTELRELSARSSSLSDHSSAADEPAATAAAAGSAHAMACCQLQQQWAGSAKPLLHSSSSSSRCPSLGPDSSEDAAAAAAAAALGVSQARVTVSAVPASAPEVAGSGLCLMQEDWPLLEAPDFMELLDGLSSDDPDACFGLEQLTGEGAGCSAEDARRMWPGNASGRRWPLG